MSKIAIAGGGVLGSQVAFQVAYCGYDVKVWLRSENFFKETQTKLDNLKQNYINALKEMALYKEKPVNWYGGLSSENDFDLDVLLQRVEKAYNSIELVTDLSVATKDVEFVVECISENLQDKRIFFKMLSPLISKDTIVVTNSSSYVPSKFVKYISNSERFLALHFSSPVIENNIAEIMPHANTYQKHYAKTIEFAKSLNMIPLPINKENKGYLMNAMLMPFLFSALDLYAKNISSIEAIDKAWKKGTSSKLGPFEIIDMVGLKLVYGVVLEYTKIPKILAPYDFKKIAKMMKQFISQGKLGKGSGEGFYSYK